jgi:uncharacterized membrane protein required for colicin V production
MTLPIEYSEVLILVVLIFAVVGMMRGWYREGITSLFVAFLAVLVWQPDIAAGIINWINDLIKYIINFITSGFSFDSAKLAVQQSSANTPLDPSSYELWIIITVIMVLVSYLIGEATFKGKVTPLSRIVGGFLGAANGYVLVSLAKEYLFKTAVAQGQVSAQSTGPVSIQLTNVPTASLQGAGIVFVLVIVIAVVGLLVAGDKIGLPLK